MTEGYVVFLVLEAFSGNWVVYGDFVTRSFLIGYTVICTFLIRV